MVPLLGARVPLLVERVTNKSHYHCNKRSQKSKMLYFVVLYNSSAIFIISLQLNFYAATKYAIAKYFIQLVHCTMHNNIQAE